MIQKQENRNPCTDQAHSEPKTKRRRRLVALTSSASALEKVNALAEGRGQQIMKTALEVRQPRTENKNGLPDIWKVRGDCRCLFRAVDRAIRDPSNKHDRDVRGEATSEEQRSRELICADDL